jgi:hypothetical protein
VPIFEDPQAARAGRAVCLLLCLAVLGGAVQAAPPATTAADRCLQPQPFAGRVYRGDTALPNRPAADDVVGNVPPDLARDLDQAIAGILARSGAPGVTAAIAVPGLGRWSASLGLASAAPPQPLLPDARFWWASVGKAFTVATVLKLIEEGKLQGSDRLANWYPRYPNAERITIEQMLTHTSGIGSFPQPGDDPRDTMVYVPPETIIERSAARGAVVACPGERWSYSNTAMVMLGRIIERLEGRPFHEVVAAKVIHPLGLTRMLAAPPLPDLADLPREHLDGKPQPAFNAMTFAAGNIVASAADMVTFWRAFISGKVLPTAVLRDSMRTFHLFDRGSVSPALRTDMYFGRGIMLFEVWPETGGKPQRWLAHIGGGIGSNALVLQDMDSGIVLAIAFNGRTDIVLAASTLLRVASAAQPALINEFNVMSPTRDGTLLANDIVRPAAPGRYPVLFFRTPYGKARLGYDAAAWWAERGYAVVTQDTRGRYDSDGKWSLLVHEADDGRDSHEWLARQPWSDGRIVTQGASYDGIVQWLAARDPHPALRGMISVVSPSDLYRTASYGGGAFSLSLNTLYASLMDGRVMHEKDLDFVRWSEVFKHLPVVDAPSVAGRNVEWYRDLVRHPTRDGFWQGLSWENSYEMWDFPVFNVGGWFDTFNASGGTIDAFVKLRQRSAAQARAGHRLIMGPWAHQFSRPPGQVDFGPMAQLDLRAIYLRWMDHYIKGKQNGAENDAPVKVFTMGENRWHDYADWPPPGVSYRKFFLRSGGRANTAAGDGRLSTEPDTDSAAADRYTYDPPDPVPTLGGATCCWTQIVPFGAVDQRPLEARSDVLVYSTPPLEEDLRVTGPVSIRLWVSSSAPDTDFVARLIDVAPDGFAMNLTDGILRARYREGFETPQLMDPGQVYEISIPMGATSNLFRKGPRIRVHVTSSNFPRYSRNTNTGTQPELDTRMQPAAQTVWHTSDRPSQLLLPVLDSSH